MVWPGASPRKQAGSEQAVTAKVLLGFHAGVCAYQSWPSFAKNPKQTQLRV